MEWINPFINNANEPNKNPTIGNCTFIFSFGTKEKSKGISKNESLYSKYLAAISACRVNKQ